MPPNRYHGMFTPKSLLTLPVRLPVTALVAVAEHLLARPDIPDALLWRESSAPPQEHLTDESARLDLRRR